MSVDLHSLIEGDVRSLRKLLVESALSSEMMNKALCLSVSLGKAEMVRALAENGSDVNLRNSRSGWSLVHSAVEHRQMDVIRELVRLGADINATDASGATPLHLALDLEFDAAEQLQKRPDPAIVRLLFELGADPTIRDAAGSSARDLAVALGLEDLMDI